MQIVQFYRGDPNAPKPTRGAHLGANAVITWDDRILLEKRWDCGAWGLPGGGVKAHETEEEAMVRDALAAQGVGCETLWDKSAPPPRWTRPGSLNWRQERSMLSSPPGGWKSCPTGISSTSVGTGERMP